MIITLIVLIALSIGVAGGAALQYVASKPLTVRPREPELVPLVPAISGSIPGRCARGETG